MRYGPLTICASVALGLASMGLVAPAFAADPAVPPGVVPPTTPLAALPPNDPLPARPPLPPVTPPVPLAWERHFALGVDFGLAIRPGGSSRDDKSAPSRLQPAPAWGLHLTWDVFKYLQFGGYFIGAAHNLDLPPGSFGLSGSLTADRAVSTYVFGARIAPTLPLGKRVRLWLTAGAGWGRISYPRLQDTEGSHAPFRIPARDLFIVELPVGVGASFEIIPRWLSLQICGTGGFLLSQQGSAVEKSQAIDYAGKKRDVSPAPRLDGTFVQTIGLALLL